MNSNCDFLNDYNGDRNQQIIISLHNFDNNIEIFIPIDELLHLKFSLKASTKGVKKVF